jgi:hypothetical protein
MDANCRFQGEQGYINPIVMPGDKLCGINGTYFYHSPPVNGVRPKLRPSGSGAINVWVDVVSQPYLHSLTYAHTCADKKRDVWAS